MPGVGAGGLVGIALETVSGTYLAPTKFVPINSETLQYLGEPIFRRPIRQSADAVWALPGNVSVGGDIEMDALEDCIAVLLHASRASVNKSGVDPNFTYTFTPTAAAIPTKTLSITVLRNDEVFGYTGCIVSGYRFSISDGVLTFAVTIVGRDEATQATPTPITWPTTVPFGVGQYDIEIPTGVAVLDNDTFEFGIADNAEPQFRNKSTGRGAQFVKFGERAVTLTLGRDFENKADYDAFKAVTSQSITLKASKGTNNEISLLIPVSIKNSYELGLSSQGDLLRGNIAYTGLLGAGSSYTVTVKTQEDIS